MLKIRTMGQALKKIQIMKNFMLLLTLLLISTSCSKKQDASRQQDIEQTIITLERQALDKWAKGDPVGFAANFANDATYFDDIGAQKRIDNSENLKSYFSSLDGKIPSHLYKLIAPKVQVYGDIAILTLQYHSTINDEPGPPWKATSVYRLVDDKWQVVHANWSLIKE